MEILRWTFIACYLIASFLVMLRILMDNRQPAKTMAWVLVLFFLPVLGIILYFFFGRDTRKERYVSQRSLDQLTKRSMLEFAEQHDLHLPERHRPLINLFSNQNMALPFKDNEVEIFTSGYTFSPPCCVSSARRATISISTGLLSTTIRWAIFSPMC